MFRIVSLVFISCTLVFSLGCQTTKKETDEIPIDVSADPSVTSEPISFDPMGSDGGNIEGLKTVNFPYDKATLTKKAEKDLQSNVEWMRANGGFKIQIEGHCDSRGSTEYNLRLGERRAETVARYLSTLGIEENRLKTISYGEEKPLVYGDSESNHAQNRRANFVPLSQ